MSRCVSITDRTAAARSYLPIGLFAVLLLGAWSTVWAPLDTRPDLPREPPAAYAGNATVEYGIEVLNDTNGCWDLRVHRTGTTGLVNVSLAFYQDTTHRQYIDWGDEDELHRVPISRSPGASTDVGCTGQNASTGLPVVARLEFQSYGPFDRERPTSGHTGISTRPAAAPPAAPRKSRGP